jgi:hypothetical protein
VDVYRSISTFLQGGNTMQINTNYGAPPAYSAMQKNAATQDKEVSAEKAGASQEQTASPASSKRRSVEEYTQYLQDKFGYVNKSTTMEGVPTNVSVSPAFLRKAANDPETAKFLEENLAVLPDSAKYLVDHGLGTITNIEYKFSADGKITGTVSSTNDPDGSIARENAERKAKEVKEKEEVAEKKSAEKKNAAKKAEEQSEEKLLAEQLTAKLTDKLTHARSAAADRSDVGEELTVLESAAPERKPFAAEGDTIDLRA